MSIIIGMAEFASRILVFLAYHYHELFVISLFLFVLGMVVSHFEGNAPEDDGKNDEKEENSLNKPQEVNPDPSKNDQNGEKAGFGGWLWRERVQ